MDFYYCKMVLEVYLCKEKNAEKKTNMYSMWEK